MQLSSFATLQLQPKSFSKCPYVHMSMEKQVNKRSFVLSRVRRHAKMSGRQTDKLLSRMLLDSTPHFVRLSIRPLVGPLVTLYFFYDFYFFSSLLLPKWCIDLNNGPCPPARDCGSRVSGLVLS